MKKSITIIIIILALIVILALVFDFGRREAVAPNLNQTNATTSDEITVNFPTDNQAVTSPIQIKGKVVGNWFFEGSFPVELLNSNGEVIATATASTPEDWATTSVIDFSATLVYPKATSTDRGLIILKNDNPSGDPSRDKKDFIPVILK